MSELKPCPCGQVPTSLTLNCKPRDKWGWASGHCCSEWWVEFRNQYASDLDEMLANATRAWNGTPRPTPNNSAAGSNTDSEQYRTVPVEPLDVEGCGECSGRGWDADVVIRGVAHFAGCSKARPHHITAELKRLWHKVIEYENPDPVAPPADEPDELRRLEREIAEASAIHTTTKGVDSNWWKYSRQPKLHRYLELRGLLERHPDNPELVRIADEEARHFVPITPEEMETLNQALQRTAERIDEADNDQDSS